MSLLDDFHIFTFLNLLKSCFTNEQAITLNRNVTYLVYWSPTNVISNHLLPSDIITSPIVPKQPSKNSN